MFAVSTSTFVRLFLEPRMHNIALRRSAKDSFVRIQFVTDETGRSRLSAIFVDNTEIHFSASLPEPPLWAKTKGVNEPCSTCKTR